VTVKLTRKPLESLSTRENELVFTHSIGRRSFFCILDHVLHDHLFRLRTRRFALHHRSPPAGEQFCDTVTVPGRSDEPVREGMVTVRPNGFIEPCIPTRAVNPPIGPDWAHEIKHDGYRLIVRREGGAVRLFTRRGYDWTDRYPAIAAAAVKLRSRSFTIDGEAVVVGVDGVAVFDALHRRQRAADAILYAFDLLELNAKDQRPSPLVERKAKLAKLLARAPAASSTTRTPTRTAPWCFGMPASSASRASCRSD
jgi:ATP dependent DNA ligase domain